MGKGLVFMLSERPHHVNDVTSSTCAMYSSGVSVSCLGLDPNHPFFHLLNNTTLCGFMNGGSGLAVK